MDIKNLNTTYWSTVAPADIIGENDFPSADFLKLLKRRARVLNVGCGNGAVSEFLSAKGLGVYGIDLNEAAINAAR